MEQPLQVFILQKEELGVVYYNTGRVIVYPFFFFLCFRKKGLKECQKKKVDEVGKKRRIVIFHRVKHLLENAAMHSWLLYLLCYMNYTRRESPKSLSHVNLRFKNYP